MRFQIGQNTGAANVRWAGDAVSESGGRQRARHLFPGSHVCEIEGCGRRAERHHKDGDTRNNDRSNIAFLCNKHHKEADGRMTRPEFREAHRRAMLGRKHTPEHASKISAALKRAYAEGRRPDIRAKQSAAARARYASTPKPTHCPKGHPYDDANTYVRHNGQRDCKTCGRDRALRYYHAQKGAA